MKYRFEKRGIKVMLQFCLVNVRSSAVYFANAPSKLFSEGKLGEPKEKIGNLNGFEYICTLVGLRYHILYSYSVSI
jgi:hypothetical protein